jgi:hypothetical protein
MPYQLNGQLVTIKSQRLLHATGAVTAAGSGAFVTKSADIAARGDAAMSNAKTPSMQREVRLMDRHLEAVHFNRGILAAFRGCAKVEGDFRIAFPRIVATGSQ